jgi:alkylation response protein AidB-like acyl-CoA dehydrogenase
VSDPGGADQDEFRAITLDDMAMPGGWSVSSGQTFLFRSARLLRIGAGSDEIMKFLTAREVLREVTGDGARR